MKDQKCICGRKPAKRQRYFDLSYGWGSRESKRFTPPLCDVCWDVDLFVRKNIKNKHNPNPEYDELQPAIEKYRQERIEYYQQTQEEISK